MFEKIKNTIAEQALVKDLTELKQKCIDLNDHVGDELSKTVGVAVTDLLGLLRKVKAGVSDMLETHFQVNPEEDKSPDDTAEPEIDESVEV